jgi:Zn-dependent protease with chaperone function
MVLFVMMLGALSFLNVEIVRPYVDEINVKEVYHRLAVVSGTTKLPPITILDIPMINAWTDGKKITITTGLLKLMKNNDELAMVLGHEMGHFIARDVQRNDEAMDPRYMEADADKFGAFIMMRAGYDVCKGKEILRSFKEVFGDDAAAEGHPDNAFRLDQLDLPQCHKG